MVVDYSQLGLSYRLYSCEVYYNLALSMLSLGETEPGNANLAVAMQRKPVLDRPADYYKEIDKALILGPTKAVEKLDPFAVPLRTGVFRPPGKNKTGPTLSQRLKAAPTFPVVVRPNYQSWEQTQKEQDVRESVAYGSASQSFDPYSPVDNYGNEAAALEGSQSTSDDQIPSGGLAAELQRKAKSLKKMKSANDAVPTMESNRRTFGSISDARGPAGSPVVSSVSSEPWRSSPAVDGGSPSSTRPMSFTDQLKSIVDQMKNAKTRSGPTVRAPDRFLEEHSGDEVAQSPTFAPRPLQDAPRPMSTVSFASFAANKVGFAKGLYQTGKRKLMSGLHRSGSNATTKTRYAPSSSTSLAFQGLSMPFTSAYGPNAGSWTLLCGSSSEILMTLKISS
jgi:hypothetical protein